MSGLADQDFLKGLQDDIVKAVYAFGLHDGMHKAAVAAKLTGRLDGALAFNTVSASTKDAFLAILARVLDQAGGGSLSKVKSQKNIETPVGFGKKVSGLQNSEAAKTLKAWRNGILSHKDANATAAAIAADAELQIYDDYLCLLKETFICMGDLCRENGMDFAGVSRKVTAKTEQILDGLMKQASESGELLTRKLFDLDSA